MGKENLGMIHVYTGDCKGKTTTSLGMALRAVGQNLKVCIIQFMKGGAYTGELIAIKNYFPKEKISIHQYGKPCVKEHRQLKLHGFNDDDEKFPDVDFVREEIDCGPCRSCFLADEEEKLLIIDAFAHAKKALVSGEYDMVILDEINNALKKGTLPVDDVLSLLKEKHIHTEAILTGRGAPQEIIDAADLVTDMKEVKHYFNKGITARRGIEY